MTELECLIDAWRAARARRERAALATVIDVDGSSYRRPGAQMLVTAGQVVTGIISGGCLDKDLVIRSAEVMRTGLSQVVTYDGRSGEDVVWGLGLGCNGCVRVLIEPIDEGAPGGSALQIVANGLRDRRGASGVTFLHPDAGRGPSTEDAIMGRLWFDDELALVDRSGRVPSTSGELDAVRAILSPRDGTGSAGAANGRRATLIPPPDGSSSPYVFVQRFAVPSSLVVFGAERDAESLVSLASRIGWQVTVVDTRERQDISARFPSASRVVGLTAVEADLGTFISVEASVVVMTHHFRDDARVIELVGKTPLAYLGVMGPAKRTRKLIDDVVARGSGIEPAQLEARLHGPIGLDLGAEGPDEIALAIIAEIQAVRHGRTGGFLMGRSTAIHAPREADGAGGPIRIELKAS